MRNIIIFILLGVSLNYYSDAQKPVKITLNAKDSISEKSIFEFKETNDSHNVKLIFRTKSFNPKEHKIEHVRDAAKDWDILKIDGKEPFGAESSFIPKTEIESLKLIWDEKEISVEKDLFADCYLPNFEEHTLG